MIDCPSLAWQQDRQAIWSLARPPAGKRGWTIGYPTGVYVTCRKMSFASVISVFTCQKE